MSLRKIVGFLIMLLLALGMLAFLLAFLKQISLALAMQAIFEQSDKIPVLYYNKNSGECCLLNSSKLTYQCWNSSLLGCLMQVGEKWITISPGGGGE